MLYRYNKYHKIKDKEWIDILTSTPCDEAAHRYFFETKCTTFLTYISATMLDNSDCSTILGEFYELLSDNNWYVLRQFKSTNGASLGSYLSRCTVNHILAVKKQEGRLNTVSIDEPQIIKELDYFTEEEEKETLPVWQAFSRLKLRDRITLRMLIIEGKSSMQAAHKIWPHIKSETQDWQTLPPKRVQDTIAAIKRRALLSLSHELRKIYKGLL